MQQSSSSIGVLAAALAKAQLALVNPEKSMIATIRADDKGGAEQIFRYAPLSSGLEILRKTLGQHEIAILQATAIDQAAGVVKLTTMLCHSSGEWVGSTWPVCSVEEMARPKRMGAALTYARRYALFTLAGIAGEDDLDAPDLNALRPVDTPTKKVLLNGQTRPAGRRTFIGQNSTAARDAGEHANPALRQQLSAILRDQLLNQLNEVNSVESAAIWARRTLPAKNDLSAADARQVEQAFRARLAELNDCTDEAAAQIPSPLSTLKPPPSPQPQPLKSNAVADGIDKSRLSHPEPRRLRDREHVRFVAKQPCLVCGRNPSDPHHLRFVQRQALGRKVSDEYTVPLCRVHHRELHRCGDEAVWWQKAAIDPTASARALWLQTHPLPASSTRAH
jgi:ERF superfamily